MSLLLLGTLALPAPVAATDSPGPLQPAAPAGETRSHVIFSDSGRPPDPRSAPGARPAGLPPAEGVGRSGRTSSSSGPSAHVTPLSTSAGRPAEVFGFAQSGEVASGAWTQDIWMDHVSTIAYAGINIAADGGLVTSDSGYQTWGGSQMTALIDAAHNAGDAVVLTIESFDTSTISSIVGSETTRQKCIAGVLGQLSGRNVEGVNVDFEGYSSAIAGNFTTFIHELRQSLLAQTPQRSYLTVDTFGSSAQGGTMMDIGGLSPYVDAFMVMAYDLTSPGSANAGPVAPLNGYSYTDNSIVASYLGIVPPSQLILGVPYYGYKWSVTQPVAQAPTIGGGTGVTYADSLSDFACAEQLTQHFDPTFYEPWATWWSPASGDPCGGNRNSWREVYYENAQALDGKYALVNSRSLRGVGIWALGYDTGRSELYAEIAGNFTVAHVPSQAGLSPGRGTTRGGTIVTITGRHLSSTTSVQFGPLPAAAFTVLDDGTIQATSPAGMAGTVDITVTTPLGTSGISPVDQFTYVTPSAGSYAGSQPTRICDTRPANATYRIAVNQCNAGGAGASLGPNQSLNVSVCDGFGGSAGCTAGAVTVNVAVTGGSAPSYLTVYPAGAMRPLTSTINFGAGQTRSNLAEVAVGDRGQVTVYNAQGTVDVVIDLEGATPSSGAFSSGSPGLFHPMAPVRVCDTRPANASSSIPVNPCDAGGAGASLGEGATMNVQMTGQGGVPSSGVSAVVFNLTVTGPTAGSYMTAWPAANPRPLAANLNWGPGQTVPNRVVVPVGHSGQVSLFNAVGSADVVVDVGGWFGDGTEGPPAGAVVTGVVPTRICDTRATAATSGIVTNQCNHGGSGASLGQDPPLTVQVTGAGMPVPEGAVAVVLHVAVTNTDAGSYLTVWPSDVVTRPLAADLNWVGGQTVGNLVVVKLSAAGAISAFNAAGRTDVVIDVMGFYS